MWANYETWALYEYLARTASFRQRVSRLARQSWNDTPPVSPAAPAGAAEAIPRRQRALALFAERLRAMIEQANPEAHDAGCYSDIDWLQIAVLFLSETREA